MACLKCGYQPVVGRPKKVADDTVRTLREEGLSYTQIARKLCVSRGAVQASIERIKKTDRLNGPKS